WRVARTASGCTRGCRPNRCGPLHPQSRRDWLLESLRLHPTPPRRPDGCCTCRSRNVRREGPAFPLPAAAEEREGPAVAGGGWRGRWRLREHWIARIVPDDRPDDRTGGCADCTSDADLVATIVVGRAGGVRKARGSATDEDGASRSAEHGAAPPRTLCVAAK